MNILFLVLAENREEHLSELLVDEATRRDAVAHILDSGGEIAVLGTFSTDTIPPRWVGEPVKPGKAFHISIFPHGGLETNVEIASKIMAVRDELRTLISQPTPQASEPGATAA